MFFEYAVDPAVLSSWERVRYFLDAFGPWKGRFLAEYPRRWRKMVYQGLTCPDVERKRIVERLARLDPRAFSPRSGAPYDPALDWLSNAEAEHQREPFRAIVATSASGSHVLDASAVDEAAELWRVDPGKLLAREPAVVVQAILLLLRASSRILLIDPYFRADQGDKALMLRELCRAVAGQSVEIEVHFADEHAGYGACIGHANRVLPTLLPCTTTVTLHCWRERVGGPRLHNRYLLTDTGGVQFGDGIERGEPGHDDRISILEEATRARLWNQYASASPAFDPAGAPCQFRGR